MSIGSILLLILIGGGLYGTNHYFQQVDKVLHPVYDVAQTELPRDQALQVMDPETGVLRYTGWSRFPNKLSYQPELSKTYWPILSRNKAWNYFYVKNDDYLVTLAHVNVGVIKSAYVNILKIGGNYDVTETLIEDYLGQYVFIDTNKNGDGIYSVVQHPQLEMKSVKVEGDSTVKVNIKSQTDQHEITADLKGINLGEGITHIENQTPDGAFNSFNTKFLLDFVGKVKLNGQTILSCTEAKPCHGLHDNGRSVGKYINKWVWGTLSFTSKPSKSSKKGHKVGLNLSLSEQGQTASGDAIWVDGKLYKLDATQVTKVTPTEWKITTHPSATKYPKNKIDITFKVGDKHTIGKNFIAIELDFNSNFGFFSGKIETEEGHKIQFEDEFGFIEEMFSRW